MGRPRKTRRPQEADVRVKDVPESLPQSLPVIMPASDSAMDLDLDFALFDMNDSSILELLGSSQHAPQPKPALQQSRSPGIMHMMGAQHPAQEIDFTHLQRHHPQPLSEEFSLEQAAGILSADVPDTLPALSPEQASDPQPHICSCLASLYLALDSLQHPSKSALSAIKTARSASKTAYDTITCPVCSIPPLDPTDTNPPIQSLQNMMMLGALLPSISNAYKTIVQQVDDEAAAATASGTRLTFDLSSYGGLWGGLAAPDSLCGTADNVDGRELEPETWRLAVRALLKVDVYGLSDCTPGMERLGRELWQPGLKDIIQMMEERSRSRHEEVDRLVREGTLKMDGRCDYVPLDNDRGDKPTCLRIIEVARRSVMSLDIP